MDADTIRFHAGPLRAAAEQKAEKLGLTLSDVCRRALAAELGLPVPEVVRGNPDILTAQAAAVDARFGPRGRDGVRRRRRGRKKVS